MNHHRLGGYKSSFGLQTKFRRDTAGIVCMEFASTLTWHESITSIVASLIRKSGGEKNTRCKNDIEQLLGSQVQRSSSILYHAIPHLLGFLAVSEQFQPHTMLVSKMGLHEGSLAFAPLDLIIRRLFTELHNSTRRYDASQAFLGEDSSSHGKRRHKVIRRNTSAVDTSVSLSFEFPPSSQWFFFFISISFYFP